MMVSVVELALSPRRRSAVPRLEGTLHPDFTPVAEVLRHVLQEFPGGAAVAVYHRGELVVDIWGGARDRSGHRWERDTMSPSFSTTKGVAATLIHILADRGMLDYDDRVADHWPEFGQAGKHGITVRHVLAHQSGLYHIRQMVDRADRMLDWDYMIGAIEAAAPIHVPGERTGYHGLTFGYIVGELARRVAGKPFPLLVQEEIVGPLGLDGMYVGAPLEVLPRAAQLLWARPGLISPAEGPRNDPGERLERAAVTVRRALRRAGLDFGWLAALDALAPRGITSFDFSAHSTLQAAIPAANGLFTARSLARMYAALAGGGEVDGVRLLSRRTLRRATQEQQRTRRRSVIPWDMRWRLGYHGVLTTAGVPQRGFGHFGFGGSGAFADPESDLSVGLIVNAGMGTPFGDLRVVRIGGAALSSALGRAPLARRTTIAAQREPRATVRRAPSVRRVAAP